MGTFRLTVPGRLDRIREITGLVGEAARQAGFDSRSAYACELAVGEACENIIKHGYQTEDRGDIRVSIASLPGELTIELVDSAPPFNPAHAPDTRDWTPEDPPVGGLGLLIIHRVMDQVQYLRRRGHNILRLVKHLPPEAV
ncbi:MAG: hypothetical protein A2Y93_13855 [Chloroflexi bacterium RBG_13_68_17]|jgi:anti-sigma regulatory factor (Ser/Thr protein kinase)|nr:MAG: hypothetical protein A2Y93_13855 [Chloroflexi bacterium RBG_13_68_17]